MNSYYYQYMLNLNCNDNKNKNNKNDKNEEEEPCYQKKRLRFPVTNVMWLSLNLTSACNFLQLKLLLIDFFGHL